MLRILLSLALCIVLSGCSSSKTQPPSSPINSDTLQPGLSVVYINKFYRNIKEMPAVDQVEGFGHSGAPILHINHSFGKGEVFGSGRSRGVAMQMTGVIHLTKPGAYAFKAMANDGIQLIINNTLIFEDPKYHSDRFSPIGEFHPPTAGRFPLVLRYFQRKGTATLSLYWQPPGETSFSVIPADAYGHYPNGSVK